MAKKKYNEDIAASGDLRDLAGLPKHVTFGAQKKRLSGQVPAGRSHIDGDMAMGRACVAALRASGDFDRATQGFHTYPARLHPEAASRLLGVLGGQTLGDPFCGGGTVLVEGLI
ncbi:MAG: hypothetical protein FWC40_09140, partial [Proteobacteria bacterium]|nr:hypothetical protein [Pseudomonadota bacterium]